MNPLCVEELWVYPVKSLRGYQVQSALVEPRGLQYDRRWMVVDQDGVFLTQRDHAAMATISTGVDDRGLCLGADTFGSVRVALDAQGERLPVRVWSFDCTAVAPSVEVDAWLTEVLGEPCRLVAMEDECARPANAPLAQPEDVVSFADACPVLFVTHASMEELNSKMSEPLPLDRFRANVVVGGAEAWDEDDWRTLRVGETTFRYLKPCGRCGMTTIDQETGEMRNQEPLRTLATYRIINQKVCFGVYCAPNRLGQIRVGDSVRPE